MESKNELENVTTAANGVVEGQKDVSDRNKTLRDFIKEKVSVVEGVSSLIGLSEDEKRKSISKGNIFDVEVSSVSEDDSYDNSEDAIKKLMDDILNASNEPSGDPILQGGTTERIKVGSKTVDVALIKVVNQLCNNQKSGSYQTFKFMIGLHQNLSSDVETFEESWDLDLSGKKIDLNRPGKTSLVDGYITSYMNEGRIELSVTLPVSGNDQEVFDSQFQDQFSQLFSYLLDSTLKEIVEKQPESVEDLADAEIRLTSRSLITNEIRNALVARQSSKTEDEIEDDIKDIYPYVASKLDICPLTSKSVTIGVYAALVEKKSKEDCDWESTNRKWKYFNSNDLVMRTRPIQNSSQTVPVTDKVFELFKTYGTDLFCKFVDSMNDILTGQLGLGKINHSAGNITIPEHSDKLSLSLGVTPKVLAQKKKAFREMAKKAIDEVILAREKNDKTDAMKNMTKM